jgi:hypothetical protein
MGPLLNFPSFGTLPTFSHAGFSHHQPIFTAFPSPTPPHKGEGLARGSPPRFIFLQSPVSNSLSPFRQIPCSTAPWPLYATSTEKPFPADAICLAMAPPQPIPPPCGEGGGRGLWRGELPTLRHAGLDPASSHAKSFAWGDVLPRVRGSFRLTDVRRLDPGSGAGVTEDGGGFGHFIEPLTLLVLVSRICLANPAPLWGGCPEGAGGVFGAAISPLSVMPDPIRYPVTRCSSREETPLPRVTESFRLTDVRRLDPGSGAGVTENEGLSHSTEDEGASRIPWNLSSCEPLSVGTPWSRHGLSSLCQPPNSPSCGNLSIIPHPRPCGGDPVGERLRAERTSLFVGMSPSREGLRAAGSPPQGRG